MKLLLLVVVFLLGVEVVLLIHFISWKWNHRKED